MLSLSLSPKYNNFKIYLPDNFIPKEVSKKYDKLLLQDTSIFLNTTTLLNETIKGIKIPGLTDILKTQNQVSRNTKIEPSNGPGLGRISIENSHENTYYDLTNPLQKIEKKIKITFRHIQDFVNYFILYETILLKYSRPELFEGETHLYINILNENNNLSSTLKLQQIHIDGIEGLEFSYNKNKRESGTFDIELAYNNLSFDFNV